MSQSKPTPSDELDEILAMEMQTLYSQAHHTGVRVQLTKESIDKARSTLLTWRDKAVAEAEGRAKLEVIHIFKEWADATEITYNDMMRSVIPKPLTPPKQDNG